eukprot:Phypoly_transcript_12691.p1 GENE.Phypoly_transcript_12691~~Phypoly_transcript_12691.p1  ORF type:complete len:178 (+),score=21.06 Phypoly_transcript_12691:177-710(+)
MGNTLLIAAVILSLAALGCVIVSWALEWYEIETKITLPGITTTTTEKYYWKKYTTSISVNSGHSSKDTDYNKNIEPKVKQLFDTCLTLLTIGGAVLIGFIVLVGLRLIFFKKSGFIRWVGAIAGIVASVFLAVSFFAFLNITKAFKEDYDCTSNQCDKLIGKHDGTKWGPGIPSLSP